MKYMGSKQAMLLNGLGETIVEQAEGRARVVDLFSGSGAVAWFAAAGTHSKVVAVDLQHYAAVLANAVVRRTTPASIPVLRQTWLLPARRAALRTPQRRVTQSWWTDETSILTKQDVLRAREICAGSPGGLVWKAYGGHYYSPRQAHALDLLLEELPKRPPERDLCLAATIVAASRCAAAPGHTAQPFQPTPGALPHIASAWRKNPFAAALEALEGLAARFARVRGDALVEDALSYAGRVRENDLVVLDPPYSAVQYSRFYHVLEAVARGESGLVSGIGRYPPFADRPASAFSRKTESHAALEKLLASLAKRGCRVVLTFPEGKASNGLSGDIVREVASTHFDVVSAKIASRFSTLGGNNAGRPARRDAHELILTLRPL